VQARFRTEDHTNPILDLYWIPVVDDTYRKS